MPAFVSQPVGRTNSAGTAATFDAVVTGEAPFVYQWTKDGIPLQDNGVIVGARSATLIVTNVQPDNAGRYQLVVTNAYGSAASALAVLTVVTPPVLAVPLVTQTAELGSTATFYVRLTNSSITVGYQWYFRDTNQPVLATNAVLLLTDIQPGDAGTYLLVVTNLAGITTSTGSLSVIAPVPRRTLPALSLYGEPGILLNLSSVDTLSANNSWQPLDSVILTNPPQLYLDVSEPVRSHRFYRVWHTSASLAPPLLEVGMATEIALTGPVGNQMRIDYINQFGPTDAWVALGTATLTNTTQSYFDLSMWRAPSRLYRVVPVP